MSADKFQALALYDPAAVPKGRRKKKEILKVNTYNKASLEANGKHVSMTFCLFSIFIPRTLCHQVHSRNRTGGYQVRDGVLLWVRV